MAQLCFRQTLAALALLALSGPALACPFCPGSSKTLTQEAGDAMMILWGTPTNPQLDPAAEFRGTTDLQIDIVVKDHAFLAGRKVITLNRYINTDPKNPTKYLVFCDVFNGKLDAYRGVALKPDSRIATYLKGSLAIKDKDVTTKLAYFFQFLDSNELDVSSDAFGEFSNSDYKDFQPLAEKLPPDTILKWLKDENTPAARFGLYGSMLGHCGKEEHAKTLRALLDDPMKRFASGIDGMLAGYIMLDRKAGWQYVRDILKDSSREFLLRYAALRCARFFWEFRPDVVEKQELVDAIAILIEQDDIADLAIEDLRKWKRWELTDRILGLFEKKSHDIPIIQRSILRFALNCPKENAKAIEFVDAQKKKDAERVKDVDELLQLELETKPVPVPTTPAATKGPPAPKTK